MPGTCKACLGVGFTCTPDKRNEINFIDGLTPDDRGTIPVTVNLTPCSECDGVGPLTVYHVEEAVRDGLKRKEQTMIHLRLPFQKKEEENDRNNNI